MEPPGKPHVSLHTVNKPTHKGQQHAGLTHYAAGTLPQLTPGTRDTVRLFYAPTHTPPPLQYPSSTPFLNSLPHPPHLPPLTHPWHPNWLKVAASPLLGLLLPLLLHLPLLPKQLLLLPPFPSVTPWLQPGDGKRPGSGWVGSPRNGESRTDKDGGQEGQGGIGGKGPWPLHSSLLSESAPVQEAKAGGPLGRASGLAVLRKRR